MSRLGSAGLLIATVALLAACGRKDGAAISTTPTSLPAGDSLASTTAPVTGGATATSAGLVGEGAQTAAVSPPSTASGGLNVSPPAFASAGGRGPGVASAPH